MHFGILVKDSTILNHFMGAKVTVIGAISLKKLVGLMALNGAMDGKAFSVFGEHFLVPNLWDGAVDVN
jgi:putative transposase